MLDYHTFVFCCYLFHFRVLHTDLKAMAVVENAPNQDASVAGQDQSKLQNNVQSNDQRLYDKIDGPHDQINGGDLLGSNNGGDGGDEVAYRLKRDMEELQQMFSKLNLIAQEFVLHSLFQQIDLHNKNNNISKNGIANNGNGAVKKQPTESRHYQILEALHLCLRSLSSPVQQKLHIICYTTARVQEFRQNQA